MPAVLFAVDINIERAAAFNFLHPIRGEGGSSACTEILKLDSVCGELVQLRRTDVLAFAAETWKRGRPVSFAMQRNAQCTGRVGALGGAAVEPRVFENRDDLPVA